MSKPLILIKIGGSAITDKSKPYTLRPIVMKRIAKEIKKSKKTNLILVHGAGSFAHTSAKKYGGKKGYKSSIGIAKVSSDASKLNQLFTDILIDEKVPVISIRPMSLVIAKNGKAVSKNFKIIEQIINQHLIPVLYGDVIWDKKWGSTIFSGEIIINELSKYLIEAGYKIEKIIQVGETDGVYDENGNTIKNINLQNIKTVYNFLENSNRADVTGGIKHKIEESIQLAKNNIDTYIINGLKSNHLCNAIMNKNVNGTKVSRS